MLPRGRSWPPPVRPRLPAWLLYRVQRLLAPNAFYRWLAGWLERSPARYRAFTAAEKTVKSGVFGCRMCGQCALPVTGYACPMTCPKQLRNGPCGGVGSDGSCEVHPDLRCVWLVAFERAEAVRAGRRPAPAAAPHRPPGLGTELVGQLLERAGRRPVGHRRRPGDGAAMTSPRSSLRSSLESAQTTVTAEVGPPRGADPEAVRRKVEPLRGWVDAVNITDGQGAHARLSNWAGSLLALAAGVEPVMQVTCRDRNRIALQSDLLSAAALGIPNVVLMTGDHPRFGDHPDAKPVFDLDSVQLVWTARTMRDEGRLLSGRTLDPPPRWLIGAVENPFAPPAGFRAARLGKKVTAGAEFAQTQFVFDVPAFARWMADVRDLGLDRRCKILAGVGPVRSLRALEYMQGSVPGLWIPDEIGRRLRGVPADRVADEGLTMCAEIIQQVLEIPGVSGVHVMAPGFSRGIPEVLARAGLARPVGAGAGSGHAH